MQVNVLGKQHCVREELRDDIHSSGSERILLAVPVQIQQKKILTPYWQVFQTSYPLLSSIAFILLSFKL